MEAFVKTHFAIIISFALLQPAAAPSQPASSSIPDQAALVQSDNAFATDLYGQLRNTTGNLFSRPQAFPLRSPWPTPARAAKPHPKWPTRSTSLCLRIVRIRPWARCSPSFNSPHQNYQLRVADALWAENNEKFLPAFLNLNKSDYGAGFHPIDFKTRARCRALTINQWVAQQTNNKITNLLAPGSVTPATRLILTNAIYFKGAVEPTVPRVQYQPLPTFISPHRSPSKRRLCIKRQPIRLLRRRNIPGPPASLHRRSALHDRLPAQRH